MSLPGHPSDADSAHEQAFPSVRDISLQSLDELEDLLSRTNSECAHWQTWEALREISVGRIRGHSEDAQTRFRWVRLALAALRRRAAACEEDPVATMVGEACIRSAAIQEFGPEADGGIRDPAVLCGAVFQAIGRSQSQMRFDTAGWRRLPIPEILLLRRAKNMLTALKSLEAVDFEPSVRAELSAWLTLIPELP